MGTFSQDDVLVIARTVIEDPLNYMDGDFAPYFFCDYCEAKLRGYGILATDFKHELHCPVLVAQDILTGYET